MGYLWLINRRGYLPPELFPLSNACLQAQKVGHAGTLDPFATGVLIVCVNQATRLARFWLNSAKTYQAELFLGIETDTQDPTGTVISTCEAVEFPKIRCGPS